MLYDRMRAGPRGSCESFGCFTEGTLTTVAIDRYRVLYDDDYPLAKRNGGTTVNSLPSPPPTE